MCGADPRFLCCAARVNVLGEPHLKRAPFYPTAHVLLLHVDNSLGKSLVTFGAFPPLAPAGRP